MEIAHAQTGVLRLVGKIALLGLLVVLLAKVILTLLAVAAVVLLTYFSSRALYTRRACIKRALLRTKETFTQSVTAVFQASTALFVESAGWLSACGSWVLLRLSQFAMLSATALVALALLSRGVTFGCVTTWNFVRRSQEVLAPSFQAFFYYARKITRTLAQLSVRGCVRILRAGQAGWVMTCNQFQLICGTVVETVSGAVVGAMLGFICLPHLHTVEATVTGAALLGAFLGLVVGLSRATRVKEGELSNLLESQN